MLQTLAHPGDPSATLSFSDVADTDVDVETLTVTAFTGNIGHGTLALGTNGAYTYTLDNGNSAVQALDDGETLTDSYTYTVSDGTVSRTATLTITIFGTNDAPVANADTNWAQEDVANASGNVLQTLAHPGDPSATPELLGRRRHRRGCRDPDGHRVHRQHRSRHAGPGHATVPTPTRWTTAIPPCRPSTTAKR